jgi:hypothetical protein
MPSPHADFVCTSKKCETAEGATVYDLPVSATHCPHGHKRLKRLFNAVNVSMRREPPQARPKRLRPISTAGRAASKGVAPALDEMIEPVFDRKAEVAASVNRHPGVVAGRASDMGALMARAITGHAHPAVAQAFSGVSAGKAGAARPSDSGNPLPGGRVLPRPRPAAGSPSVSRKELGM